MKKGRGSSSPLFRGPIETARSQIAVGSAHFDKLVFALFLALFGLLARLSRSTLGTAAG
jgi:hypothetical protein